MKEQIKEIVGGLKNLIPKKEVVVLDAKKYNDLMKRIKLLQEVKTYQSLLFFFFTMTNKNKINELTNKPYEKVNRVCLKCGNNVFKTDIKGYSYVCLKCNENMFNFETEKQDSLHLKEVLNKVIEKLDTYSYHLISKPMSKESKIKIDWEIDGLKSELINFKKEVLK